MTLDKDLLTPLVHLHRGELGRMTAYRQRLDTTTHMAVVVAGGLITFVLGRPEQSANVLWLGVMLQFGFSSLEAHRYRLFALAKKRVRLLERGFYGELLGGPPAEGWQETLRESLIDPRPEMSLLSAMAVRLRVAHLFVLYGYAITWALAVLRGPARWSDAAAAGPIPGEWVALAGASVLLAATVWAAFGDAELDA